ncbi:lysozyme inhibitor LprI family protein [Caulobacter endophyticus]|uniref:lysozyme inhibitor LprI family protein n=1 Tax=Caulobacter endophyticus TaxID=2172652 RepID=UPI00240EE036|nr:lysozyme inhibitor LprI family protein [Caulobacter endophyticus]MDG2531002.1 lysozyme inhibitor LprI family protein [Caulobacter endophyticus]
MFRPRQDRGDMEGAMRVSAIAGAVAALIAMGSTGATAATPRASGYGLVYDRCVASEAAQGSDAALGACLVAEGRRQDARLNEAYRATMARLDFPRQKDALRKAQRAWLTFRDASCASVADADWGRASNLDAERCRLRRTAERADELENHPYAESRPRKLYPSTP